MKNLVLVKFNKSADKAYLFEIPLEDVVFAGEVLLVKNYLGQEQEVVAVADSFAVAEGLSLDRVCGVNGTTADNLKKAVAYVHREVIPYEYDDVKEYECSCDKANKHKTSCAKRVKDIFEEDEEQYAYAYEISKEIAKVVAEVCEDRGVDCGKITITLSDEDEEEGE